MILKQLLNGRQHSDFILIKDNLSITAEHILRLFIENNINRGNNVLFFMYEKLDYDFNLQFRSKKNYVAYNCFDDPWNWLGKESKSKTFEEIVSSMSSMKENPMNVIIVDSLYYLFLHMDIYSWCEHMKMILNANSETCRNQFITVLHMEFWPEESHELNQIEFLAKSVITLKQDTKHEVNLVSVEHEKPSGKIIGEEYICNIGTQGIFSYETAKNVPKEFTPVDSHPEDLTTFKLTLEDNERETRSRVVLPYIKTEDKPGRIFYVPDANDDWDEEDPDDDLEI